MSEHITDDDLVLHFYGEMDHGAEARAVSHLGSCDRCRGSFTRLQQVLAAVDAMPAPVLSEGFERTVWARLEPALPARERGWRSWFVIAPASLAWAAAIVVLVAAAFLAGRFTTRPADTGTTTIASAEQIRERVLLSDLGEHLERSQTMLIELVSAEDGASEPVDISLERERAQELVAANRLYRQTTAANGETNVAQLLDELERLLVELAASPDRVAPADMERVQQQIDAKDLLFKVRVVSSAIRARQQQQQQQIQSRRGAGQSS